MERLPSAFAVTTGPDHLLTYANAAFRHLFPRELIALPMGASIELAFREEARENVRTLLAHAFRTGIVARNRRLESANEVFGAFVCTIWPQVSEKGFTETLLVELRAATEFDIHAAVQRDVAERLLLSALRAEDAAAFAEVARRGAAFLAAEGRRLAESLDVEATLAAMERMSLPPIGAWCIVDTLDDDGMMHRMSIVHPDPAVQAILAAQGARWVPNIDDMFGVPVAMRRAISSVIVDNVEEVIATSARDPELREALSYLRAGSLLTVPMTVRDQLIGAVTFVSARRHKYTALDIELAEDLAGRAASSLDRARAHRNALRLTEEAQVANAGKSKFLGMMSHELRTPLNAIGGYVELIDMGLRGPVTDEQREDLARIRRSQRYLIGLISDLLNFTKVGAGKYLYRTADVDACLVLTTAATMLEPLVRQKPLLFDGVECAPDIVMRGDEERILQILINLIGNAIKFSPPGSRLVINGECDESIARLHVCDTGIGIPPDKLETIFDPFVQVTGGLTTPERGVGLGLAISRELARGMGGDLVVVSTLGEGARFTLSLPRKT